MPSSFTVSHQSPERPRPRGSATDTGAVSRRRSTFRRLLTSTRASSAQLAGMSTRRPRRRGRVRRRAVSRSPTAAISRSRTSTLDIRKNFVTAFIGPSGCGKSTFIRCFNRMNDLVPGRRRRRARCSTTAATSTAPNVDPVEVRRRIGMVFQKPNPFPKSIYDNVAFGPRVLRHEGRPRRARRARAAARRALGRGEGPAQGERARRSPAASSSASASRARSPSSRT